MQGKLVKFFSGQQYSDAAAAFRHGLEISKEIRENKAPRKVSPMPPLSRFNLRVKGLAQKHLGGGQYSNLGIASALLMRDGVQEPSREQVEKMRSRVESVLRTLKRRGEIPATTVQSKRPLPAKRSVSSAQVKQYERLVKYLLVRGHRYLARDWRDYLSFRDAVQIGTSGISRGIELHDSSSGAREITHVANHIASAVTGEVRKIKRASRRVVSLDSPDFDNRRLMHEKIGRPAFVPCESDLHLLFNSTKPHYFMPWLLCDAFGHDKSEVAKVLGVSYQAVQQAVAKARVKLQKKKLAA